MTEVTREEFESLAKRVATLEEREEERASIARAFAKQGQESAERRARPGGPVPYAEAVLVPYEGKHL